MIYAPRPAGSGAEGNAGKDAPLRLFLIFLPPCTHVVSSSPRAFLKGLARLSGLCI
jgi:hypothetical protein